jgi:hypothetical protein
MNTLSGLRAAAVLPLLLVTVACAQEQGEDPTGAGGPVDTRYPADAVVLRIESTGGFVTPETIATRLPSVTVYGDGRILTEGPVPLLYPGPALPNIQVGTLSPEEVTRLLDRAREAGVGTAADLGTPNITDVPATRFTLRGPTGSEQTEVAALDAGGPDSGLTAEQQAAREKLRTFAQSVTDAPDSSGAAATPAETTPYVPTALAALARPFTADEAAPKQPEIAWPGPELPGPALGSTGDLHCVTVTGPALTKVLDAAAKANAATGWTSQGKTWTLTLRPLLPDETDCADLAANR